MAIWRSSVDWGGQSTWKAPLLVEGSAMKAMSEEAAVLRGSIKWELKVLSRLGGTG